jgi:transcriptional regulator with XRE-family HTH domain
MHHTPRTSLLRTSHIALVIEQIRRHSGLTTEALTSRTETDPAHIAAVLSGSRFPSRRLTIRIAHACGADHFILLKVWEDEYRRRHPDTTQPADEPPSTRPPVPPTGAVTSTVDNPTATEDGRHEDRFSGADTTAS